MPVGNLVGVTERADAHTAVLAFLVVSCGVCRSYQNSSVVGCGRGLIIEGAGNLALLFGVLPTLEGGGFPSVALEILFVQVTPPAFLEEMFLAFGWPTGVEGGEVRMGPRARPGWAPFE